MAEEIKGKLKSLEPQDIEQVCGLIREFRIAMSNLLLYPSGSNLVTESIGNVGATLSNLLSKYNIFILSESEGNLLANGVRLEKETSATSGVFIETLDVCGIKSITFKPGITIKEIYLLMENLAKKRGLKGTGDSITEMFKREQVIHIGLNERVYAAIGDADLVIERGADLIEKSGGSIDGIMEALQGVTEMVASIDEQSKRDNVKLEIAKKLIANDPKLLVQLVKNEPNAKAATENTVGEGEIGFSQVEIKAIVNDITGAYRELAKGGETGLRLLKNTIDRILSLTKTRVPSLELYNELVKQTDTDALSKSAESKVKNREETVEEKLEDFVNEDTLSLITEEATKSIQRLLENSVSDNELKLAGKVCERLTQNFNAVLSDIRYRTALAVKNLYSTIEDLRDGEVVSSVDDKLIDVEKKESHEGTYVEVASILSQAVNRYLKEAKHEKSLDIIRLFRKHTQSGSEGFTGRQKQAESTMHKFGESELTRILLDEFCSMDEVKRKKATTLLMELGNFSTSSLIKKIKETGNLEIRKAIAFLLERIGDTATTRLIEELDTEKRTESTLRIIELMDKIGHEGLVAEQLRAILSNPDFQIRRAAIYKLNQIGTDRAKQIILDTLVNDPSSVIRRLAVGFIGDMRYASAITALIDMISPRNSPVGKAEESMQEEACIALGKIGDPTAISALREAAQPPRTFRAVKPEGIRVAAVQALAKIGDKELSKFANDKNQLIRKIVGETTAVQEAALKENPQQS